MRPLSLSLAGGAGRLELTSEAAVAILATLAERSAGRRPEVGGDHEQPDVSAHPADRKYRSSGMRTADGCCDLR